MNYIYTYIFFFSITSGFKYLLHEGIYERFQWVYRIFEFSKAHGKSVGRL